MRTATVSACGSRSTFFDMTKTCPKCKLSKSLDDFHKNKSNKDGHQTYCKACTSALQRSKGASDTNNAPEAKGASNGQLEAKESQSRAPERYQIVRRISRRTKQCSWGLYDDLNQAEIFVGDCLQDVLDEKEKLETPPPRWTYKCRTGQVGFITNDDPVAA
jgi:hypothetical protein